MKTPHRQKLVSAAAITSVVAAFFVLLIVVFHREEKQRIAAESYALLETITASKQVLLSDWITDEIHDVSLIRKNKTLVELTNRFVEGQVDESSLVSVLNQIKLEHNYAELVFLNETGEYLASTNPALTFNDSIDRDILARALQTDSSYVSDIYRSSIDHRIYIDLVTVIRNEYGKPLGGIIFKIHPDKTIDKMLADYRITGYRGAVSLIRMQPNKQWMVYHPDSSFSTNLTCWKPLPVRFKNDPFDVHHRLVRVSSFPNSPWEVMVTLDDSKRNADLRASIILSGTLGFALVLIFFFGVWYFSFYREQDYAVKLGEKEDKLNMLTKKFQFSMDLLGEAVVITDAEGKLSYMNFAAEQLSGWKLTDVVGKPLDKQIPLMQEESGMPLLSVKNWFSGERAYNQDVPTYLINKAGSRIRVVCSLAPLQVDISKNVGLIIVLVKENRQQVTNQEPSDEIDSHFTTSKTDQKN